MTDLEQMSAEIQKFIYNPHPTAEERIEAHRNLTKILEIAEHLGLPAPAVDMSKVKTDAENREISGIELNLPVNASDIMDQIKTTALGHYCEHCGNWYDDKDLVPCISCPPGNLYCSDCMGPHYDEAHTIPLGKPSYD